MPHGVVVTAVEINGFASESEVKNVLRSSKIVADQVRTVKGYVAQRRLFLVRLVVSLIIFFIVHRRERLFFSFALVFFFFFSEQANGCFFFFSDCLGEGTFQIGILWCVF